MRPQRGVVTDGIYRNEFFKVALPVKEGSVILDDRTNYEQVKAGGMPVTEADMELADGVLAFEEMEKVFMGRNRDFAMYNEEYKFSLVVQYDNMKMVHGCIKTMDECVEMLQNQYKQVNPQVETSIETIWLGWSEYKRLTVLHGGALYNYYLRQQDEYMVCIAYFGWEGNYTGREEFEISVL